MKSNNEKIIEDLATVKTQIAGWGEQTSIYQKYLDEKFTNLSKEIKDTIHNFAEENRSVALKITELEKNQKILEKEVYTGKVQRSLLISIAGVIFTVLTFLVNLYFNLFNK